MNVNSIKVNNSDININTKSQNHKYLTFGVNNDTYISSKTNDTSKSKKRKRNLIISSILVTLSAVALGGLYYSGKKAKKTPLSSSKTSEIIPNTTQNMLKNFQKDLDNSLTSSTTLEDNIVKMNNLLQSEVEDEKLLTNILTCIGNHYKKLISRINYPSEKKVKRIEEYCQLLSQLGNAKDTIKYYQNKKVQLENKLEIDKQISSLNQDENLDMLNKLLKNNEKDLDYKNEFIKTIITKYIKSDEIIIKILEAINNNTDDNLLEKSQIELSSKISSIYKNCQSPIELCDNLIDIQNKTDILNNLSPYVKSHEAYKNFKGQAYNLPTSNLVVDLIKATLIKEKDKLDNKFNFSIDDNKISFKYKYNNKEKLCIYDLVKNNYTIK